MLPLRPIFSGFATVVGFKTGFGGEQALITMIIECSVNAKSNVRNYFPMTRQQSDSAEVIDPDGILDYRPSYNQLMNRFFSGLAAIVAIASLNACGKKEAAPPPPLSAEFQNQKPGTPTPPKAAANLPPPPPVPVYTPPVTPEGEKIDYAALNAALTAYCKKTQVNPISLDEVVAAGFLKSLPKLPPGKRFGINRENDTVLVEDIPVAPSVTNATHAATSPGATPPPGVPPPPK